MYSVFLFQEKPHDVFQRSGTDLMMKKTVTLTEALCGFTTVVDHLDGRKIVVNHPPGSVLVPGNKSLNIWVFIGPEIIHLKLRTIHIHWCMNKNTLMGYLCIGDPLLIMLMMLKLISA